MGGIRKASDNARGSQPSNSTAYEFHLNPDNCRSCNESSGSFLDDYLPRLRHSLRTTACWLQVTQAGTMGSKQRVDAGSGGQILLVDRDGKGNVCCVRTILQTSLHNFLSIWEGTDLSTFPRRTRSTKIPIRRRTLHCMQAMRSYLPRPVKTVLFSWFNSTVFADRSKCRAAPCKACSASSSSSSSEL